MIRFTSSSHVVDVLVVTCSRTDPNPAEHEFLIAHLDQHSFDPTSSDPQVQSCTAAHSVQCSPSSIPSLCRSVDASPQGLLTSLSCPSGTIWSSIWSVKTQAHKRDTYIILVSTGDVLVLCLILEGSPLLSVPFLERGSLAPNFGSRGSRCTLARSE
jgi:hypothetical protein